MLFHCWPTVFDARPTLKQHLLNASCLLGSAYLVHFLDPVAVSPEQLSLVQEVIVHLCLCGTPHWHSRVPRHNPGIATVRNVNLHSFMEHTRSLKR